MNDTSQNEFVDAYRDALNKAGFNPKNVLMSMPTKKFNKHSKVYYRIQTSEFKKRKTLFLSISIRPITQNEQRFSQIR